MKGREGKGREGKGMGRARGNWDAFAESAERKEHRPDRQPKAISVRWYVASLPGQQSRILPGDTLSPLVSPRGDSRASTAEVPVHPKLTLPVVPL
ncbi:hypothetical protein GZL_02223 [Streptomyces sp. 769]|nr:hypothetical protein GZL_02223 [Streptomyces sp. 769]